MTAKSVSGLSRASRSTTIENRSVYAKSTKEIDATKLSPLTKEKLENFQEIMESAKAIINKLFLDDQTVVQVEEAYSNSFQAGTKIITQGYKQLTEKNTSPFFKRWTDLLSVLEVYFDLNPNERYTQFIDELTKKIVNVVQPLEEFVFDEDYPNEAKKSKKQAKLEQDSFEKSMGILSQQNYKYFKGKLSTSAFTQTVNQLINSITNFDNLFFHQPREDAKGILYKTHAYLKRILDAIYDYHAEEKSITECDTQLSLITQKLKQFFKIKTKNNSNPELQPEDSYSDEENRNKHNDDYDDYYEYDESNNKPHKQLDDTDENDTKRRKSLNNSAKHQLTQNQNDENNSRRRAKSLSNDGNLYETEKQLRTEISDLKRSIKKIKQKISLKQGPDANEDTDLKAKISDLSFTSDYLNQIIIQKEEFIEEAQKDIENFKSFNSQLEDITFNNSQNVDLKVNSYTRNLKRQIISLNDNLETFSDDLEKYRQLTSKSSKIRPQRSNKTEIVRAIIELKEQNKAIQSSIDDMEEIEEDLTNQEKKLGTADSPRNQILIDMMNFIDSRRRESKEIENQLKNSKPIQKIKKISKELEAYRNDKFASNINSEFLNTKKQLEETRNTFNSCLSNLNDSLNVLMESIIEEGEESIDLFQIELGDKKNLKYIISHDAFCRVEKETAIKHSLKNRMKMINQWIEEKCPQYNKFDIPTDEKLKLLLKEAKSRNRKNQD